MNKIEVKYAKVGGYYNFCKKTNRYSTEMLIYLLMELEERFNNYYGYTNQTGLKLLHSYIYPLESHLEKLKYTRYHTYPIVVKNGNLITTDMKFLDIYIIWNKTIPWLNPPRIVLPVIKERDSYELSRNINLYKLAKNTHCHVLTSIDLVNIGKIIDHIAKMFYMHELYNNYGFKIKRPILELDY